MRPLGGQPEYFCNGLNVGEESLKKPSEVEINDPMSGCAERSGLGGRWPFPQVGGQWRAACEVSQTTGRHSREKYTILIPTTKLPRYVLTLKKKSEKTVGGGAQRSGWAFHDVYEI